MSACPVKFGATLPFTGRGIHVLFLLPWFFLSCWNWQSLAILGVDYRFASPQGEQDTR